MYTLLYSLYFLKKFDIIFIYSVFFSSIQLLYYRKLNFNKIFFKLLNLYNSVFH